MARRRKARTKDVIEKRDPNPIGVHARGNFFAEVWKAGKRYYWAGGKSLVRDINKAISFTSALAAGKKARDLQEWFDRRRVEAAEWRDRQRERIANGLKAIGRGLAKTPGLIKRSAQRWIDRPSKHQMSQESRPAQMPAPVPAPSPPKAGKGDRNDAALKEAIRKVEESPGFRGWSAEGKPITEFTEWMKASDDEKSRASLAMKAVQDARKTETTVHAHDRKGSKGVKQHNRKLTPQEQKQQVAKDLLKDAQQNQ